MHELILPFKLLYLFFRESVYPSKRLNGRVQRVNQPSKGEIELATSCGILNKIKRE
jgi:hypothetical protein